jgi:hypothetical protein
VAYYRRRGVAATDRDRALGYLLRKGSKPLYRQPAFLICTGQTLSPATIFETYFQRWDIEVNFREQKTLLGVGQAQVRSTQSVEDAPALGVASYAILLSAAQRAFASSRDAMLPRERRNKSSTAINQLRAEIWGRGPGLHDFYAFKHPLPADTKPEKSSFPVASAALYPELRKAKSRHRCEAPPIVVHMISKKCNRLILIYLSIFIQSSFHSRTVY